MEKMICIKKDSPGGAYYPNYMEEVTILRTEKGIMTDVYVIEGYEIDEDGDECGYEVQYFREPNFTNALTMKLAEEFSSDTIERIEQPERVFTLDAEF